VKKIRILAAMTLLLVATSVVVFADYAYTPVIIGVATSKGFSVTLNGQSATNSNPSHPGTATSTVWFNSTDGNTKQQNATVAGANGQVGPYPECTTPIAVFKNTGTVTISLNIKLNNTVTGAILFYNSSMKSGSTTGTANTTIAALEAAGSTFVTGLGINNETNVCIWTNFTDVAGGQYYTWFNYTSS